MKLYWMFYAAFCLAHLTACFLENHRLRKISKVLLMPLLAFGLFLSGGRNGLMYLGLFLGWQGDVFLLSERKKFFIFGALSFALGHFAYMGAALGVFLANNSLRDIPPWLMLIFAAAVLLLYLLARCKFSARLGMMAYVGAAYFSVLFAAVLVSALSGSYLLMASFLIFALSDTLIVITRFHKKIKRSHFFVMSTYILAQTLIGLSLI